MRALDILMVGADPGNCQTRVTFLNARGHRARWVIGSEAMPGASAEDKPQVYFFDCALGPVEFDCVRKLRAADPRAGILVCLASLGAEAAVQAFEAGADNYLRRPYDSEELLACLDSLARWIPESL